MGKYLLSNRAVEDLSEIWEYTFETWSEIQADKYYEHIVRSFEEIARNPQIGKSYKELDSAIRGLRVGKHLIFYQVVPPDVEIIRILHENMDLKTRIDE